MLLVQPSQAPLYKTETWSETNPILFKLGLLGGLYHCAQQQPHISFLHGVELSHQKTSWQLYWLHERVDAMHKDLLSQAQLIKAIWKLDIFLFALYNF